MGGGVRTGRTDRPLLAVWSEINGGDASGGCLLQGNGRSGGTQRRTTAGLTGGATLRWDSVGMTQNRTRLARERQRSGRLRLEITGEGWRRGTAVGTSPDLKKKAVPVVIFIEARVWKH